MFKVDWEKRFAKYVDTPEEDSGKAAEDNTAEQNGRIAKT
jgi:hypothetical protein